MNEYVVYDSIFDLIKDNSWGGACYATTAIMHTLLKLVDIESTPCIGVVECINGDIFDHAWLEVSGKVFDIAIAYPKGVSKSTVAAFVDPSGYRGVEETPNIKYGIDMTLDSEAKFVAEKFSNIMEQSPFWAEQNIDHWDITEFIAKFHGINVEKDDLLKSVIDSEWCIKKEPNKRLW